MLSDEEIKQIRLEENQFYKRVFDGVNSNLPNGTKIAVNGFGGSFIFPNKSRIEFIPHFECNKSDSLVKSNTLYHTLKIFELLDIETSPENLEKIKQYVKNKVNG